VARCSGTCYEKGELYQRKVFNIFAKTFIRTYEIVHNIKYMHLKHIPLLGAGVNVNLK
jgi:hypothetical protein